MAHRDVLSEESDEHINDDDEDICEHERRAILACQEAVEIYQGWLLDHDDDDVNAAADNAAPQSQQPPLQQHHVHSHPDDNP